MDVPIISRWLGNIEYSMLRLNMLVASKGLCGHIGDGVYDISSTSNCPICNKATRQGRERVRVWIKSNGGGQWFFQMRTLEHGH